MRPFSKRFTVRSRAVSSETAYSCMGASCYLQLLGHCDWSKTADNIAGRHAGDGLLAPRLGRATGAHEVPVVCKDHGMIKHQIQGGISRIH